MQERLDRYCSQIFLRGKKHDRPGIVKISSNFYIDLVRIAGLRKRSPVQRACIPGMGLARIWCSPSSLTA
jgi:hypothetical protein